MPPPAHIRVTFSGTLGDVAAPSEIWAMGLSFEAGTLGVQSPGDLAAVSTAAAPAFSTHIAGRVSGAVRLRRVRTAFIKADGLTDRTAGGAYRHGDALVNIPGASAATTHPPQVTLAIGLRSTFAGPTGRGRFFVPMPTGSVGTDLRMSIGDATAWATAARSFCIAVEDAVQAGGGNALVVASGGSLTKGFPPALHNVQRVECGRSFDIQKRRAGDLVEDYQGLVYPS